MKHNYTEKQIEKTMKVVETLEKCNTEIGSDSKIYDIKLLSDFSDDIYLSYICEMKGADRGTYKIYEKIDINGVKTELNTNGTPISELQEMFSTFTPLKLT